MSWWSCIAAFGATFLSVFFKGVQYKNVAANLYALAFITSYGIAFVDALLIKLVADSGLGAALASATGGAAGMVVAMVVHNRFVPKGRAP
jgi:hypothetical protein